MPLWQPLPIPFLPSLLAPFSHSTDSLHEALLVFVGFIQNCDLTAHEPWGEIWATSMESAHVSAAVHQHLEAVSPVLIWDLWDLLRGLEAQWGPKGYYRAWRWFFRSALESVEEGSDLWGPIREVVEQTEEDLMELERELEMESEDEEEWGVEPVLDVAAYSEEVEADPEERCPICYEWLEDCDDVRSLDGCGHQICRECLVELVDWPSDEVNCPMCRMVIVGARRPARLAWVRTRAWDRAREVEEEEEAIPAWADRDDELREGSFVDGHFIPSLD